MLKKLTLLALALLLAAPAAFAASYQIDAAHTQIHFTVPHLVVFKVRGNFNDFVGTVEADAASNSLSAAEATIQVASIDTRNQKRDDHLRSADFFDAANHPEMRFVSKKVEGSGANITVTGDLTIKGITKEVVLQGAFLGAATDPWGNQRAGFEATGKINRRDFGLLWNKALETGGMVVGDEIEIGLEVESVMKK
ncbi:MAG TPA: YceI family protein [Malonomonas sp.]